MKNITINPAIEDKEQILIMVEAYRQSGTNKSINEYAASRDEICPTVEAYLKGKFGDDESRILDIQIDFCSEILWVLEQRAEQILGRSDSLTYEFTPWISGAYEDVTSLMQEAQLAAFVGNMVPIDRAIEAYMASPTAKRYS